MYERASYILGDNIYEYKTYKDPVSSTYQELSVFNGKKINKQSN